MATEKFQFTKPALDALPTQDKQYEVADTKVPHLRLMINPGGTRTYLLYRKIQKRAERIKIGRYDELKLEQARSEAKRLNAVIALGGNPQEERKARREEHTVSELIDAYYSEYALHHTKRPDDNKKMLKFHFGSVYGRYNISAIDTNRIKKLHTHIGTTRGKSIANRVIHIISAMFNFAIKQGYYKLVNPCFGLQKFAMVSRDRFLNKNEIKAFFQALQPERPLFQDFFAMALYTGGRKSNVLSMRWVDINIDLKHWRIPETQTKNKDVNIVILSAPALDILKRRFEENQKLETPSEYVFPGDNSSVHLKDPKRAFSRIKERMNVDDIRIHDLRRTLGSYMAISGASLSIIGSALNHKSMHSTEVYARLNQDSVRTAIDNATTLMNTQS